MTGHGLHGLPRRQNSKQLQLHWLRLFARFEILCNAAPGNEVFFSTARNITFFNCTVRKMQMSQQKYRSSRCLLMCLLRSTSDDLSAPQTAQLTLVSGAVPFAWALKCLWNAFSMVQAYEHKEHRYSSLSYLRNERHNKSKDHLTKFRNMQPLLQILGEIVSCRLLAVYCPFSLKCICFTSYV